MQFITIFSGKLNTDNQLTKAITPVILHIVFTCKDAGKKALTDCKRVATIFLKITI